MRFAHLPQNLGQRVAALPWLLEFQPGSTRLGWLAANEGRIVAVGAAKTEYAHKPAFAAFFALELAPHRFDHLLIASPPGADQAGRAFAEHIAGSGTVVELVQSSAASWRASGETAWRKVPEPPMEILASGRTAPAASWEALTERYSLTPGPGALEEAPVLTHLQMAGLDQLRPRSRHTAALRALDAIADPRAPGRPDDVARLAYLMTDPVLRVTVLREAVLDRTRMSGLVTAHRVAHLEHGAELRGVAALGTYVTAATPTLSQWIGVHAPDAAMSRQAERLFMKHVPSSIPRAVAVGDVPTKMLDLADEQWVRAHTTPMPPGVADLEQRLGASAPGLG